MFAHVLALRHNGEVACAVVVLVPVDVMDYLPGQECAPEHLLGHDSMFVPTAALYVSARPFSSLFVAALGRG